MSRFIIIKWNQNIWLQLLSACWLLRPFWLALKVVKNQWWFFFTPKQTTPLEKIRSVKVFTTSHKKTNFWTSQIRLLKIKITITTKIGWSWRIANWKAEAEEEQAKVDIRAIEAALQVFQAILTGTVVLRVLNVDDCEAPKGLAWALVGMVACICTCIGIGCCLHCRAKNKNKTTEVEVVD